MASIQNFQGQTIKCKAAVAYEPNKALVIETIEVAPPKANEVRIKMYATGVCHSDLHSIDGHILELFPMVFGHEGSGIVESIGDNVTTVVVGDHVIPSMMAQCRNCRNCLHPDNNICEKTKFTSVDAPGVFEDGKTRYTTSNGKPIYHFMSGGCFSEYLVTNEYSCCKINPEAPLEKACLLGCGIGTGIGAVLNVAKVKSGSNVGVWGAGCVGLAVIQAAQIAGAKNIVAIDLNSSRLELAKALGATECINPSEYPSDKPIQQILSEKFPDGLDYTFECVGNVKVMQAALESARMGSGVCCIVGVAPVDTFVSVNPLFLLCGITIKGSCFGGLKSRDDIPKLVERYLKKEIKVDEFVTNEFKLEQINEALDLLRKGNGVRSVIRF